MLMELDNYRNELEWLIRCHNCAADDCPEEECPPRALSIPSDYIENLQRRVGKSNEGNFATHIEYGYQDILSTTRTSSARSSTTAE